jgi:hypothetical protein
MTENTPANENSNSQKRTQAGLYRVRDIINGLLAMVDDNCVSEGQVLSTVKKAVVKHLG